MATETSKKRNKTNKKPAAKAAVKNTKGKSAEPAAVTTAKVPAPIVTAAGPSPAKIKPANKKGGGSWKRWNTWLAVLYALQGLVIVVIGGKIAAPVVMPYPSVDTLASEANGHTVVSAAFRHLFDLDFGWLVVAVLLVFAAVRFGLAMFMRPREENAVEWDRTVAIMRWAGFGIGGGLVVVTIAMLSGIFELTSLVLLFASVLVGSVLALIAEIMIDRNNGKKTRLSHLVCAGAVTGVLLPWLVFITSLLGALIWHGHVAGYMYSVYACMALLFVAVILAQHFRIVRQGRWADVMYSERGFMVLEFLTASLLAWQVYAGVLHA